MGAASLRFMAAIELHGDYDLYRRLALGVFKERWGFFNARSLSSSSEGDAGAQPKIACAAASAGSSADVPLNKWSTIHVLSR